jgi:hypothetical protein
MAFERFPGFLSALENSAGSVFYPDALRSEDPDVVWVSKVYACDLGAGRTLRGEADTELVVCGIAFVGKEKTGDIEFEG